MKTLKELKDYTRKAIEEIGLANEEKYDFVVSFGVKKVEIRGDDWKLLNKQKAKKHNGKI